MARASLFSSLLLLSEVLSASSETSPIKDIQSNDESSSRRDFQPVAMENLFCEEIDGIFMDGFECTCSLVTFDCQGEESICVTGPENESDFCGSFSYTGELTVEGPTSLEFHINISITKAIRQGKELEDSTVTATMCTGNTNELELCGKHLATFFFLFLGTGPSSLNEISAHSYF